MLPNYNNVNILSDCEVNYRGRGEESLLFCVLYLTESLLSVKKSRLLASLDAAALASASSGSAVNNSRCSNDNANLDALDMDAEFAAFQVMAKIYVQFVVCFKVALLAILCPV